MQFLPLKVYSQLSVRNLYSYMYAGFNKDYFFSGETHNFWEMVYIVKGSIGITSGEKTYICGEGSVVFHSPNIFHTFWVEGDNDCVILDVGFDGAGIDNYLKAGMYILDDEERNIMLYLINEGIETFGYEFNGDVATLVGNFPSDDVKYQIIKSQLEMICLHIVRKGKQARITPYQTTKSKCYSSIAMYLRENVDRMLTMDIISKEVFESPAKIKEIFRLFTGGGVIQFFSRLRCERIMALLKEGASVKEISERMEFSSPYYLSYFFKRETGMTCREYLNSVK